MNNDALERAFRRVSTKAWRLAYALTYSVPDAEDLLQQSLLVAAKKRHRIPDADPWPWMAAVIHNEARNLRRKRARQAALALEEATMAADKSAAPPEQAARAESLRKLRDAMRALPTPQRDALAAGYIAGLTQRQGAKALGIPLGTYKKHTRDGLAALRSKLKVDEARAQALIPLLPVPALLPGWEGLMLQSIPSQAIPGVLIGGITMKKAIYATAGVLVLALAAFLVVPELITPGVESSTGIARDEANPGPVTEPEVAAPEQPASSREAAPPQSEPQPSDAMVPSGESRLDATQPAETANPEAEGAQAGAHSAMISGRVVSGKGLGVEGAAVSSGRSSTRTGNGGWFELNESWSGSESLTLRVTATADGFAPAASREIQLAPGANVASLVLVLHEGAAVFGRVVWDGGEEPAQGVQVSATFMGSGQDSDVDRTFTVRTATTDAEGAFRLSGMAPGDWRIHVRSAATTSRVEIREDGRGPQFKSDSKAVKLREGAEEGPLMLKLPRQMRLRWTLAAPAEGLVHVQLLESGRAQLPSYAGWGVGLHPDDNGVYEVDWFAADHRQLRIKAEGFAETKFPLTPRDGEDLDLGELTLSRGALLRGRVEEDSGRGIQGAVVYIRAGIDMPFVRSDGSDPRARLATAETNADGAFELAALPAGGFEIVAEHPQYAMVTAKVGIRNDEDPQPITLVMAQAGAIFGVVSIPREGSNNARPDVDGVRAISMDEGRVEELVALRTDYAAFLGKKGPHFAELDESGAYELTGLPPGRWLVVAYRNGAVDFRIGIVTEAGRHTRADFDFSPRTGSIAGNVGPASESELIVISAAGRITRATPRTKAEGSYQFDDIIAGTWYVLTPDEAVTRDAAVLEKRAVVVKPGEIARLDIDLEAAGATWSGVVTLDGAPFYKQVRLVPAFAGASERHVGIGEDGAFTATGLQSGTWHAWFRGGTGTGLGLAHAVMEVSEDLTEPWHLRFTSTPLTLTCGIELPANQRVSVMLLTDSPQSAASILSLPTGGAGPWLIAHLVAGRYSLTLEVPGSAPVAREIELAGPTEIDITPAGEGAALNLKFSYPEGFPAEGLKDWQYGRCWIEQSGYKSTTRPIPIRENYSAHVKFESLAPGQATVHFQGDAFEPMSFQVVVGSGEPSELSITPHKAARLTLTSGGPITAPEAVVHDSSGRQVQISSTLLTQGAALAEGKLHIGPLVAGTYKLTLTREGRTATLEFTVQRGQELQLPMPAYQP